MIAVLLAAALWTPHPSDGVEMHIKAEGAATRVDFDFHGHAGYAIARKQIDLDLPPNYQFVFRIRGEAPPENLELKLINGDNVWWLNRRDFVFPRQWTTLKTKKRQINFAWGPAGGGETRHVEAMEIVVTAGSGGKGTVWFEEPRLEELPVATNERLRFTTNEIDLGAKRELGGLVIEPAGEYTIALDGVPHPALRATLSRTRERGTFIWLPDLEARTITITGGNVGRVVVQPPTWAPTANDFWSIVARSAPRGEYPRYLVGEQPYWTIVGADGAKNEALVGEDGNVEPFKGGYSIEPFLRVGGKRLTWADAEITHSLADGDLPIPSVTWKVPGVTMTMTAAVSSSSMLQLRYRVDGDATLELATRNFQVNPSTQFLNSPGGVSVHPVKEKTRLNVFALNIPLEKGAKVEPLAQIKKAWREKLDRVRIETADPVVNSTIRTNLAYFLINRDGPALQPGSRSYERAWIRDGALIASALLRLGHAAEAKAFARWYAKYVFDDGKVPCCVDARGADPVPENDSHGEFIFLVAEIERYTGDAAFAKEMRPHVEAAARYIEKLRGANHGEFEGLVTESISHEGYSAKPVHSYWDDFFALKGLEDAGWKTTMREDLAASIRRTIAAKKIDYIPGAAELGDFDPSATAIAISPLGLASLLPERELARTFDRYFENLEKPREDYTPYEMRIIGALVRRGDRVRAQSLVERFLRDRRPAAWNQWAEVVGTDPRKPRFLGDMPHSWIASDFIRSVLDAIAYDREDGALVIGAGVPQSWLPLRVAGLRTYQGPVDITIDREGVVEVRGGIKNVIVAPPFRPSS
ncbi:MAG: hypothetical protein AABO58_11820 [Acidobacteriota bacterium]